MPKVTIIQKLILISSLLLFYCALHETRRITRNELTRLLGQNGGFGGFGQQKLGYKQKHVPQTGEDDGDNVNVVAQRMSKQKGIDVQPANGQMFSSLTDVAKHLQSLGVKIDTPKDPKMAELLSQYGVLHEKKGYSASPHKEMLPERLNSSGTNSHKKGKSITEHSKASVEFPKFRQERLAIMPKTELQFALG